jgi:hypothetical protein
MTARDCGRCAYCCKLLQVGDKPMFQPCAHCNPKLSGACTIYEKRPDECRKFECLWLSGGLSEMFYPPDVGFLVLPGGARCLLCVENYPGAVVKRVGFLQSCIRAGYKVEIENSINFQKKAMNSKRS